MSYIFKLLATTLALFLHSFSAVASSGHGDEGYPDAWEDYSGKCQYANKTPIDITPNIEAELPALRTLYHGYITGIKNHGHSMTLLVDVKNGVVNNNEFYALDDVHIHTPSENYIKGQQFPMEIHFVHRSQQNHTLIVSVLYQYGGRLNETTKAIVENMPDLGKRYTFDKPMALERLLPEKRNYYRFNGASAEDCKEGIMWFVFQDVVVAPEEVIEAIHARVGDNNRSLSPLNNRIILQ